METTLKIKVITSCQACDGFETKIIPCADSFCRPEKWFCKKKAGLVIDGYHDLMDKDPGIPDECPLEDYGKPKKKKKEELDENFELPQKKKEKKKNLLSIQ